MSLFEYVTLLDWTGRQVADGKSGRIPEDLSPILIRLGIVRRGLRGAVAQIIMELSRFVTSQSCNDNSTTT